MIDKTFPFQTTEMFINYFATLSFPKTSKKKNAFAFILYKVRKWNFSLSDNFEGSSWGNLANLFLACCTRMPEHAH